MPIDYSQSALPKVSPDIEKAKEARERLIVKLDEQGNQEARDRANGRCEIWIDGVHCTKPDVQTHHLLGKRGTRGRGESAKAIRKQRCCWACHPRITGQIGAGKLQRIGGAMPHYTDRYRSQK
jgi:hypothetical protein